MSIINNGFYGCIIQPYIKCTNKKLKNEKKLVSKLIDLNFIDSNEKKLYLKEIEINKFIKKMDPMKNFFLYAENSCIKKKINDNHKKLFKKCSIIKKNPKYINLIFQKGIDFNKIISSIDNNNDINKVLLYLLIILKFGLYKLKLQFYDIKSDNILFINKNNYIHPVFIDFTPEFIIQNNKFGFLFYLTNNIYWINDTNKSNKSNNSNYNDKIFIDILFNFLFNNSNGKVYNEYNNNYIKNKYKNNKYFNKVYKFFYTYILIHINHKNKSFSNQYKMFIEKYFLYKIGMAFQKSKFFNSNKFIQNIISTDIFKRFDLNSLIKKLKKSLGVNNYLQLYLNK